MIPINERSLEIWADETGINNLILVEQDLRILNILSSIYEDSEIRRYLAFKGGTAINKIYIKRESRLSIDLDFNLVGKEKDIFNNIARLRKKLLHKLAGLDAGYKLTFKYNQRQTTINIPFRPIGSIQPQKIKLEMSTWENIPILGLIARRIQLPAFNQSIEVQTYKLEELLATKIRAFYNRIKGRDLYDLALTAYPRLNKPAIRRMVHYYFYRENKIFNFDIFIKNIIAKSKDRRFREDIRMFIRPSLQFDIDKAINRFIDFYSFLKIEDECEKKFKLLAKYLQGKISSTRKLASISNIKYPLRFLMDNIAISYEASDATVEEIKLPRKPQK